GIGRGQRTIGSRRMDPLSPHGGGFFSPFVSTVAPDAECRDDVQGYTPMARCGTLARLCNAREVLVTQSFHTHIEPFAELLARLPVPPRRSPVLARGPGRCPAPGEPSRGCSLARPAPCGPSAPHRASSAGARSPDRARAPGSEAATPSLSEGHPPGASSSYR